MTLPNRPLRLLIHGINYAPEFVGIGKYTTELAEWFAARGHHVRVHAARPYYPEWQVPADYTPEHDEETLNGVEVRRHAIYVPKSPSGLARIRHHLSWLLASRRALLSSAKSFNPDIVLAVAPSLIGAPAALQAARKCKAVSMLHVQDFEVGAAGASGLIKSQAILSLAAWIERALMHRFDFVTTISQKMNERLHAMGLAADQTALITNWANLDTIRPKPASESRIRRELGIGDDQVAVLYAGTISKKQGLELIIDAARKLSHREDIIFLIFGDGPTKAGFEALAQDLGNVRFGPFQPTEQFDDLLAAADIHVLPQLAGAADLVLPSKLTGMMASGRPVIAAAPPSSGLAHAIGGGGMVVEPEHTNALVQAISDLASCRETRARLGAQARLRAEQFWCKEAILQRAEALLCAWAGLRQPVAFHSNDEPTRPATLAQGHASLATVRKQRASG